MSYQLIAKLWFDKIQIIESSFLLNKTNHLDHNKFCQLHIF